MNYKKKILKKYTGKGGPYTAGDIRRINQEDMTRPRVDMSKAPGPARVLGGMAKRVTGDIARGIKNAAYKTFIAPSVRYNKLQKQQDDRWRAEGEALKAGLRPMSKPGAMMKKGLLKKIVKRN